MASIQCKMCGGVVELTPDGGCGECPYCGSLTTFPKIADSHIEQLYNRAEHFRANCDFDKAAGAYEELIRQTEGDPEAYWGLVLSRFGIEYVEDPVTYERIPTCHRAQYESILVDPDYLKVLELSSGQEQELYEAQGKRIAEIQKGILAISAGEKPYDVFICYKETTDGGTRTRDSTLAQEIYYQLTNEGLKVFFSRITLEDKLGQQYEPYIFAALQSAKVMLVIGSRKEYFDAVWVRNEWSRFLALMRNDRSRLLIPCYKDMDAYDIPNELSLFQSQDMSKIGFLQDLLRGIKKVVSQGAKKSENAPADASSFIQITKLLKRANMFLSDQNWNSAQEYANRILDTDAENGEAYLVLFMAANALSSTEEITDCAKEIEKDRNLARALQYGNEKLKESLQRILSRRKKEGQAKLLRERQKRFDNAVREFETASDKEDNWKKYASAFEQLVADGEERAKEYLKVVHEFAYNCISHEISQATTSDAFIALAKQLAELPESEMKLELVKRCQNEADKITEKCATGAVRTAFFLFVAFFVFFLLLSLVCWGC